MKLQLGGPHFGGSSGLSLLGCILGWESCILQSIGPCALPASLMTPSKRSLEGFLYFQGGVVRMYILYLDDSGSAKNPKENYVVLGGICVPEKSIYWLTNQLENLAAQIYPQDPRKVEFHASDIFGGREEPWNKFSKEERIGIIKKVLGVLDAAHADIVSFACAVHKASYPNRDPIELAFEDLASRFDMYLSRLFHEAGSQHQGLIVFDNSSYETGLQTLALKYRTFGTKWRRLNAICEVPFFVDSKASRIVQLADHIAYAVFRRYEAEDIKYFNMIESRFDSYEGVVHGLCHKQPLNQSCTCPACMSRSIAKLHELS
jgi:hypothetical protein